MKIRYLGHAAFQININGHTIIIDPFISPNELAENINVDELKADYILISHGHEDHLADAETIYKNSDNPTIISNYEIINWYGEEFNGHPMNHGGEADFDFGTVKYVNAIHTSSLPDGTYGGNPGGFVIYNDDFSFYFAGDTALTYDMKLIPLTCPTLDFAILPIGDNFTMGYDDAIIASDFIECDTIVGCHYNTFEVIEIDTEDAQSAFEDSDKQLLLPDIGETIDI